MKKSWFHFVGIIAVGSLISACATISGGTSYYARVSVPNHPDAKIEYHGVLQGTGEATIKVYRKDADKFSVTLKKEGCESFTKTYTKSDYRIGALIGSLFTPTGFVPLTSIPMPLGIAVDIASGAYLKPDVSEKGIKKIDNKFFAYQIEYEGCQATPSDPEKPSSDLDMKSEKLRNLKKLLDDEVISKKEYEKEKRKILGE